MLADLKDSIKSGRDLNLQDKYGASAVSRSSWGPVGSRLVGRLVLPALAAVMVEMEGFFVM